MEDYDSRLIKHWDTVKLGYEIDMKIKYHRDVFQFLTDLKAFKEKDSLVLEVGCGTGRWLKLFGNSSRVGLDLSRSQLSNFKVGNFEPVLADARLLPFKKETFDLVFSIGVVEHFPETFASMKEHVRVCKTGKEVVIGVLNSCSLTYLCTRLSFLLRHKSYEDFVIVSGRRFSPAIFRKMLLQAGVTRLRFLITGCVVALPFIGFILNSISERGLDRFLGNEIIAYGVKK